MASGNDEHEMYEHLKGFLMSERVDVRRAATEAVLQVRNKEEHRQRILEHDGGLLLQALIRNTSYDNDDDDDDGRNISHRNKSKQEDAAAISVDALHALVYLSSHGTTANQYTEQLLQSNMIARLLEIALSNNSSSNDIVADAWRSKVNFAMALLANLTRLEQGAVEMVGRTLPDQAVTAAEMAADNSNDSASVVKKKVKPSMDLLLDRYLNPSFLVNGNNWPDNRATTEEEDVLLTVDKLDGQNYDPYQHFAAILMNVTQVEQGRRFLLQLHYTTTDQQQQEDGTSHFQRLLPQLKSVNPIRRRGTAGMVRNICLDKDSSWWLLHVVHISTHLLYPLAGPEELNVDEKAGLHPDLWLEGPDKKREVDEPTRTYLLESLLLLCSSGRKSREQLRLDRTYVILKWADMVEESEEVSALINECVQYLRRDEAGTEEGSSDAIVTEAYKRILSSTTASKQVRANDGDEEEDDGDYDGVD